MAILDDIRDGKGLKPITPTAQQESICYKCEYSNYCGMVTHLKRSGTVMVGCSKFKEKHKQTNADHIRNMTNEELSYYLDGLAGDGCPPQMSQVCNKKRYKCNVRKCWLDWLEQEIYEYENNNW